MRQFCFSLFVCVLLTGAAHAGDTISLVTLNTYWFFNGNAGHVESDRPRDTVEYSTKAGHLIGLLPNEAPLFVGFQELVEAKTSPPWRIRPAPATTTPTRLSSSVDTTPPPARTSARSWTRPPAGVFTGKPRG